MRPPFKFKTLHNFILLQHARAGVGRGGGGGGGGGGNSFNYVGVPYLTDTNSALEALGYTAWPFDPIQIAVPDLPSPWSSNTTGYYYVEAGGTNSGNGYPADPRGSLPTTPSAGDVIVLNGALNNASSTFTWNGNSSTPVFFVGASDDPDTDYMSRTSGDGIVFAGSYTIIKNIGFENGAGSPSDGVMFFSGSFQALIGGSVNDLAGFRSGFSSLCAPGDDHTLFYNCTIGPCGDWTEDTMGDNDFHGIKVFGDDHWIIDCTFTQIQGDGVQISNEGGGADPTSAQRIWCAGNTLTQCHQTGLWTKDATDIIFSQNSCVDNFDGNNNSTNAAYGGQGDYRNLWILSNFSQLNGEGVKLASTDGSDSDAYVIGNLIIDQDPQNAPDSGGFNNWGIVGRNGGETHVYFNTLHNIEGGISTLGTQNFVYGNFIDEPGTYDHLLTNDSVTNDYNFFRGSSASLTGTTAGSNDITSNTPGFVNEAADDFEPDTGSALIDVVPDSVVEGVFDLFLSRYGIDIRKDYFGNARPVNTTHDIGAIEVQ